MRSHNYYFDIYRPVDAPLYIDLFRFSRKAWHDYRHNLHALDEFNTPISPGLDLMIVRLLEVGLLMNAKCLYLVCSICYMLRSLPVHDPFCVASPDENIVLFRLSTK